MAETVQVWVQSGSGLLLQQPAGQEIGGCLDAALGQQLLLYGLRSGTVGLGGLAGEVGDQRRQPFSSQ